MRHPRYSVLDLATVKEDGSVAQAFRDGLDLAKHAERWGYTRFWLAEHHNIDGIASAATAVLIAHVAGNTSMIRVGSGGIMLTNHAPLVIAEQFGTLATLFPDRIDLGIGRAPGGDGATARALGRAMDAADNYPDQVRELLSYVGPAFPGQRVRAIPGQGTNVPVWLLGSSIFSAELAGRLGLRFAFASHFAPEQLHLALHRYRSSFKASAELPRPYVMIGVPLVAADSDEQAEFLATSVYRRFLNLLRGEPVRSAPPVDSMVWSDPERAVVESKLGAAVVGGRETLRKKLSLLLGATEADEVMFTSDLYLHSDRLRSFELAAEVMSGLTTS